MLDTAFEQALSDLRAYWRQDCMDQRLEDFCEILDRAIPTRPWGDLPDL